jgi:hypothetical protein
MKKGVPFWMALCSAFMLWSAIDVAAQMPLKQVGDVADDFELIDAISGESFHLEDFEDSIVLLDFFFYW